MLRVYDCIAHQHDLRLVALAVVIAVLGSDTAIALLRHVLTRRGRERVHWLMAAAAAAGSAIWSTHFVAMLAYQPQVEMGYGQALTALSLLFAVVLTGCGFAVAVFRRDLRMQACGGTLVGLAIAVMHYTGMLALQFPGDLTWNPLLVAASVVLGCALASAAIVVACGHKSAWRRVAAGGLLMLAICVTHFTGMAAASIRLLGGMGAVRKAISSFEMAESVSAACAVILLLSIAALALDRREARRREAENDNLRQLADIAFEGLLICDGDVIVTANKCFESMVERPRDALAGTRMEDYFSAAHDPAAAAPPGASVEETMLLVPDGQCIPVELLRKPIHYTGRLHQVVAIRDLRERRKADAEIRYLATHDPLTGLCNRAALSFGLEAQLSQSGACMPFALLALDLDHFKRVNDTFGHATGDAVLRTVAERLRANVRPCDIIGRMGGDEFAIVLAGPINNSNVAEVAERIVEVVSRPYTVEGHTTRIGVSIGVTMAQSCVESADLLMKHADVALYRAKEGGRRMSCFSNPDAEQNVPH
jgi:diguanylate cyclase (GGDEF)-like protein